MAGAEKGGFCRPKIAIPIIVEGRYDKSAILSVFDAAVITTDGFGVFNSMQKQKLIRKIAGDGKIIILTDSDGGGKQIRSYLSGIIPNAEVINLYIPKIPGKERRKKSFSKEGMLGVEGVGAEILKKVLSPFCNDGIFSDNDGTWANLTPAQLYSDGFSGRTDSQTKRDSLCEQLGLPSGLSAKALLCALNVSVKKEEYENARKKCAEN